MSHDVRSAFHGEPSSPYVAYLGDSQRPLNALLFLSPVLAVYHFGLWFVNSQYRQVANGADVMLAEMLNLVYFAGLAALRWAAPETAAADGAAVWFLRTFSSLFALFLVVFSLLFLEHLRPGRWRFKPLTFAFMALESALFSLPLFALEGLVKYVAAHGTLTLSAAAGPLSDWLAGLVLSTGAGVYEEFLFRMLLMGALFRMGAGALAPKGTALYCLVMLAQALAFAGFHYLPWSNEAFALPAFVFRLAAGLYFGYLYQERGLGVAAGTHVAYDVVAVSL